MVQIRNMPDKLRRTLKARAVQAGMSLSEYLLRELKKVGDKPSVEELLERIRSREPIRGFSSADLIRRAREERDAHIQELVSQSGRR